MVSGGEIIPTAVPHAVLDTTLKKKNVKYIKSNKNDLQTDIHCML